MGSSHFSLTLQPTDSPHFFPQGLWTLMNNRGKVQAAMGGVNQSNLPPLHGRRTLVLTKTNARIHASVLQTTIPLSGIHKFDPIC